MRTLSLALIALPLVACLGPEQPEPQPKQGPLEQAAYCPDIVAPMRHFDDTRPVPMGACGDALLIDDDNNVVLVPIDGEATTIGPFSGGESLSPRGRQLLLFDRDQLTVKLRDLNTGSEQSFAVTDSYPNLGFVISELGSGAQAWICADNTLDVIVDGARTTLSEQVNCDVVSASSMDSQLVFATLDHAVMWADTDAGTVEHTSLTGFQHDPSSDYGDRNDQLQMLSGGYVRHDIYEVTDSDGVPLPNFVRHDLFDLTHDRSPVPPQAVYSYARAALFEAPSFLVVDGELSVVRDGELVAIASNVAPLLHAPIDGSVIVFENDGPLVRYSGDDFETRDVLLSAPEREDLTLSPSGTAGASNSVTDLCATPACEQKLFSLQRFSPTGEAEPIFSASYWFILHVYDDGTVLAEAALVDGPSDDEVEPPSDALVLIGIDGQVRAEWELDEKLSVLHAAALADGRVLVSIEGLHESEALLTVDAQATSFEPVAGYNAAMRVGQLYVDALGKHVMVQHGDWGNGVSVGAIP